MMPTAWHVQTEWEVQVAYELGCSAGYEKACADITREINSAVGTELPDFRAVVRWLVRTHR